MEKVKITKIGLHETLKVKCLSRYEPLEIRVDLEVELEEGESCDSAFTGMRTRVHNMLEQALREELDLIAGRGTADRSLGVKR